MINKVKLPFFFCGVAFFMACTSGTKNSNAENQNTTTLESIELKTLSGEDVNMDEFKNKTVFINFWATWCKPCILEMPTIEKAQEQLKGRNVVFLLASNQSVEQIATFKDNRMFKLDYVQVQNFDVLNIQALPATYIFNPQGQLVFSEVGFRMWDTAENIDLITKHSGL